MMASAIGGDPAVLLELFDFAVEDFPPGGDPWIALKGHLRTRRPRNIRITLYTKEEWMTAFEGLRRIIQSTKIEIENLRVLLEEACDDTSSEETSWQGLKELFNEKRIPVTAHPEWKTTFKNLRRVAQGEKVENFEDPEHSSSRERSESTSYQESEKSDPGYHSDPAREKNGEEHSIHLVVEHGEHGEHAARKLLGFDRDDKLEGNCILQTVCKRYKIPGDVDEVVPLRFYNSFKGIEFVKDCRVVQEGLADVVFGREPPAPDEATEDDDLCSLEHHKENCECQKASESREDLERLLRCAPPGNDNLIRGNELVMNGVAKLYESSARGALGDPDLANKLGKACAQTFVAFVETMSSLQSHNPNAQTSPTPDTYQP